MVMMMDHQGDIQHTTEKVSIACQTEPNLIDKLIDNHVKKRLDDVDLYQEYVRSAQCAQFWPLDKNPIRSLVPDMVKIDLPEQYLKNESLMFDLVQAINDNGKLVNLLAKYIHHIVPNVIISKRIDLIPLITCTIRVCRDSNEQERLISLLFNLIKRPNEEQRRMILSGIIVVLQVSPNHSSSLLLPNLWDHVNDKFPERRILLAESCAALAHYVRPVMRTNLILSILIQLLKDKNVAVKAAACKSFSCLLTLIMDRNDEVFDACLSATEDIIKDVLEQTPVNFCEHRYELEQMRFCALETVYPLLCMWAVKLNRFKLELGEFYLVKAEKYFTSLVSSSSSSNSSSSSSTSPVNPSNNQIRSPSQRPLPANSLIQLVDSKAAAAAAVTRRRSVFFESRQMSSGSCSSTSSSSNSSSFFSSLRRQSTAYLISTPSASPSSDTHSNSAMLTSQRAISAYLKMLNYLIPFVFSDAVHSCAWLSKSNLNLQPLVSNSSSSETITTISPDQSPTSSTLAEGEEQAPEKQQHHHHRAEFHSSGNDVKPTSAQNVDTLSNSSDKMAAGESNSLYLFDRPLNFTNRLLSPNLIIDESAIVAFHDQLEQEHMIESLEWILNVFLPKFLKIISHFSHKKFYPSIGGTTEVLQEFLISSISSTRQLCLLFGKHLTRTRIRPLFKNFITTSNQPSLFSIYIASLTSFEPIEQQEYEEIVLSMRQNLSATNLTRNDFEILGLTIKIIATNTEQIHSPSTRQKFLTYILDALVSYSNQIMRSASSLTSSGSCNSTSGAKGTLSAALEASKMKNSQKSNHKQEQQQRTQTKEFILIIFRNILTCLIDQAARPPDWAHILVTKFLPLLISLANDSADVYVCTYARLMCAQLVETFDTYLNCPKMTKQTADAILPALSSMKGLTEQIKASNLKRQIECLTQDLNEKFFKHDENNNNSSTAPPITNVVVDTQSS